jgi:methyl-accepting chemotaxis protein
MRLVMVELSAGNLNVEFSGVNRSAEIGDFARAFRTFKTAAIEKLRLEKEAEEQRARREGERLAAEQRVIDDLNAAVGSVLEAAEAGDFLQRVPLEGKQGGIRELALTLNTMLDRVGSAIEEIFALMDHFAKGDLSKRMQGEYRGTFARLKDNSNQMADKLSAVLSHVKVGADEVASAATEISSSTADLSERTEQQATALEKPPGQCDRSTRL